MRQIALSTSLKSFLHFFFICLCVCFNSLYLFHSQCFSYIPYYYLFLPSCILFQSLSFSHSKYLSFFLALFLILDLSLFNCFHSKSRLFSKYILLLLDSPCFFSTTFLSFSSASLSTAIFLNQVLHISLISGSFSNEYLLCLVLLKCFFLFFISSLFALLSTFSFRLKFHSLVRYIFLFITV